jgi:hypothetical protein
MSYFRIPSGSNLVLNVLLTDGNASKYPLAYIYNSFMTEIVGSPAQLTYVGQGLYSNLGVNVPDGRYVVVMVVYDDPAHTIPSRYGRSSDTFDVNDIVDVAAIATAVWKLARAGNQPVGSFGEFFDAAISSRESDVAAGNRNAALGNAILHIAGDTNLLPAISNDTQALNARLTPARAAKLDYLDAPISSRAVTVDIASAVWDAPVLGHSASGSFGQRVDVPISTRASAAQLSSVPSATQNAAAVWDEAKSMHTSAGTFGEYLDGKVSAVETEANANARSNSALSAISNVNTKLGVPFTASVVLDIAEVKAKTDTIETKVNAVKAQTDLLSFTAGNVNANSQVVSDKTGFGVSTASEDSIVNKVWDEAQIDHVAVGSVGKSLSDSAAGASPAVVAAAVWDETRLSHVAVGSFGEVLDDKITSRATQADLAGIVIDLGNIELKVDQVINQTNAPAIENSVWDAARASHVAGGSFGSANQGAVTAGRAALLDNLARLDVVVSTRAQQTTADDILADSNALELRITAPRAANLDNLDASVSSRATPITAPTAADIADAVWDEGIAAHGIAGTTGRKLNDLINAPSVSAIASGVWDESSAGHVGAGTYGVRLDAAVSSRASQASLDETKGAGFNTATDSLKAVRTKVDSLPAFAGDASASNQVAILASLAGKASQGSVNAVQSAVGLIPTNPALTTDLRLANLDAAISTRATESNVNSIKGAGFNPTTDTLEKISDAVAVGLDTAPILADLLQVKGAGFNSAQHSLVQITSKATDAKLSADNAAANAASAQAEAASKASQSSVDAIAVDLALIPTNPLLTNDSRIDRLDVAVGSRLSTADFASTPVQLTQIQESVDALDFGDATQTKQDAILALVNTRATQTSVNGVASAVLSIPMDTVSNSDPRLDNLDATISSRATAAFVQSMAGTGFDTNTDSLEQIKNAIPVEVDTITIMNAINDIKGSGFVPEVDDLRHINDVAKAERAIIITDVTTLLSNGAGV